MIVLKFLHSLSEGLVLVGSVAQMVQKRGKHCCNLVVATHGQAAPIICRIFMLILTFLFHKINIYRIHFFFFFGSILLLFLFFWYHVYLDLSFCTYTHDQLSLVIYSVFMFSYLISSNSLLQALNNWGLALQVLLLLLQIEHSRTLLAFYIRMI